MQIDNGLSQSHFIEHNLNDHEMIKIMLHNECFDASFSFGLIKRTDWVFCVKI